MKFILLLTVALLMGNITSQAQSGIPGSEAEGRWDITLQTPQGEQPSWLEIKTSGIGALVGKFVGPAGSARPISEIKYSADKQSYTFSIPPQWSQDDTNLQVTFSLEEKKLEGTMMGLLEEEVTWTAQRAPALGRDANPSWAEPIHLLDEDLSQWEIPKNNQFQVKDGVLVNKKAGGNLVTKEEFDDFNLHVEFRYPEDSNSGIYLRGRYEVQIEDSYGKNPGSHNLGGIYGFIEPSENAAKKAGEWQTLDIILTGRMVTVELNGIEVICNRPIPGITGGALDSNEAEPGPIMIQGDHGPIEYRNIIIRPAVK